jgi:L-2,4-diaminobutyric acid acetyltransferase
MIRNIQPEDLSKIRPLIKKCKPLGFHTLYTYWVLNYHFNDLFLISEEDSGINGIISGLLSGTKTKTAFIWQIGVDPDFRGRGISQMLIREFCKKALQLGAETIQLSIDPQNTASLNAFKKYAGSINKKLRKIDTLELYDDYSDHPDTEAVFSLEICP